MAFIPDNWRIAERQALTAFTQGTLWQIGCWGTSKAPPIVLNNSPIPGTFSYGSERYNLHSIEVLMALEADGYDTNYAAHRTDPGYGLKWMFFHDANGVFQDTYNLAQHLYMANLVDPELVQESEAAAIQ